MPRRLVPRSSSAGGFPKVRTSGLGLVPFRGHNIKDNSILGSILGSPPIYGNCQIDPLKTFQRGPAQLSVVFAGPDESTPTSFGLSEITAGVEGLSGVIDGGSMSVDCIDNRDIRILRLF